ncbi:putative asparagine--tRNA ligase, mitochondrial [Lamellibrachia satsuma]|nr:putative asparagine--tRNA ligase, mitochondrial [Lamellibrachia satsuma]
MKRVKTDWRSSLAAVQLQQLMAVATEGPHPDYFDRGPAVDRKYSLGPRARRPGFNLYDCRQHQQLDDEIDEELGPMGWVKSLRQHKDVIFLNINDGSCLSSIQVVAQYGSCPGSASYGSCVRVDGVMTKSSHTEQPVEVKADTVHVFGPCDKIKYPLKTKKRHPPDYLRQYLHLRPRTNMFSSLLRIRSNAKKAFSDVLHELEYCYIDTPILTSNDCEGAGELFQVEPSQSSLQQVPDRDTGSRREGRRQEHFFNVPTFLTVSGQLHLEIMTSALSKVYTFGPTFRAENSRSRHHLSEFYMLEAEMAFLQDMDRLTEVIEFLLKNVTKRLLDSSEEDITWYLQNIAPENHGQIIDNIINKPFERLTYTDAIEILQRKNDQFEFKVEWGCDLQKEHERYLVVHCGNTPVIVTDYPACIKPFYMRINDDGKTVAAMDVLGADVGEICGGSLREERLPILEEHLAAMGIKANHEWYLDLRRFGSSPHGGFGLGFERYLQLLLGISNIKDAIPFPRSTHNCKL